MKPKMMMISMLLVVLTMTGFSQKNDVSESKATITVFQETNAETTEFFNTAYGYAIFPGIGKGGLGIGGAGGKGTVFKGGVPVADCKMSQITIGFQAGGQKYSEAIFFETAAAYERFIGDKYEFAAQVSAVALQSGVSLDAKYSDGMLIITLPLGGLMYEASIGGQKFKTKPF